VSAQQQQQQAQQQSGVLAYIYAGTANRAVVEHLLKRELIASGARVHMLAVAKSCSYIVASWNVEAPCSDPELRAVRFATSEVEFDAAAAAAPAFAGGALAPPMRGGRGGGAQQQQRVEEMGIYGAAISAPVARLQAQIDSFEGAAAPLAESQKLKYMLIAAVEQQRWLFTDSVFFAAQAGVPLFKRFSIAPVDVVFARRGFMIDELLDPPREIPRWMVPRDDDNDNGGGAAARQDGGDGSVVLRVDGVETSGRGGADGSVVKMTPVQQTVLDAFAAAARNQLDAAGRLLDKVVAADATARRLAAVLRSM
jgi:hypothetical protein